MHVPTIEDRQIHSISQGASVRPIAFHKGVVKLNRGQQIGSTQGGLLCAPQPNGEILWKGGKVDFTNDEMVEIFQEELRKGNYPVVGDTGALFKDNDITAAELLVAALIKDIRLNVCYPMSGFANWRDAKGWGYVKVEWQVYSALDRDTILKVVTEGSSSITSAVATGALDLLYNSFAQATRNLLASKTFYEVVLREKSQRKITKQTYDPIPILHVTVSDQPLIHSINDIRIAVVTIRSGTGHGSGVLIGNGNHILTNYHVVGESKHIKVITATGREILGEIIRKDKVRDVALIQVEPTGIQGLAFRPTELLVGSEVYAIGSPLSEKLNTTVSKGIVSGYRTENNLTYIQSDVNIQPGNSGGPLLDSNGNVVGIAVSGFIYKGASAGINLFVPIQEALSFLNIESKPYITTSSIKTIDSENEKRDESIATFSSLDKNTPEAIEWNQQSFENLQEREWVEAIRTATVAISLDPEFVEPYINRAWAYVEKGMYQKALTDCDHALSIEPNNLMALHNKGLTYFKMGKTEKSLKSYRKACEQGFDLSCSNFKDIMGYTPSEEVKTLLQWSDENFLKGEFEKVLDLSCKVIAIAPDNYEAYSNRCAAYASLDLLDEAKPDCEKSISLNPDFSMAYNNLGYVLEREGNISDAGLYYEMSCGLGNTLGCENQKRLNN